MAFVTFGLMTCFGIVQGNEYWGANLSIKNTINGFQGL